ncbi:hypothetical protein GIB67_021198 [Kingdonia uniflora]|uniref:alcohol dehydrogenase n=1 Tax=Kingdonia uniflora TaxID=39325 RepID=A0A7J7LFM9_9MAGN|nr:hypothetical protein GIB67_021198 [Kingdonia uniflora]
MKYYQQFRKCEIKAEVDENLTDANDRWAKIICERKQGKLSNFTYTMGDLGGNSSFSVGCVRLSDGKSRFSIKGKPIHHFVRTSAFSEYTVVHVGCLAKINPATPLDKVCVLSCGISTGSTVAVYRLGVVGLAAAEGARVSGASRIIGVDLHANRLEGGHEIAWTADSEEAEAISVIRGMEAGQRSFKWKSSLLMQSHSPRSTRRLISCFKEKVFNASLTWMDNNG